MTNIAVNDRVRIIDDKDLPPEWKLKNGIVGKVAGEYTPRDNPKNIVFMVMFRGRAAQLFPAYPMHFSRVTLHI